MELIKANKEHLTGQILPARAQAKGQQEQLPLWGIVLFGFILVVTGVEVILMGLRGNPVYPDSIWILPIVGLIFALSGLLILLMSFKQYKLEQRIKKIQKDDLANSALKDYLWDVKGGSSSGWRKAFTAIFRTIFFTLFFSVFNWWAWFSGDGVLVLKIIVSILDLVLILLWWDMFACIACAIKFGKSSIIFSQFPYKISEIIYIKWKPPFGINVKSENFKRKLKYPKELGSFTLRCVKEKVEVIGCGKDKKKTITFEELWGETFILNILSAKDDFIPLKPEEGITVTFNPNNEALPTSFKNSNPIYWEFEVKLDLPGFDFNERYLVPVY